MTLLTIGSGHRNFREFLDEKPRQRIAAYGKLVDRTFIVAFSGKGFAEQSLGNNVTVYPTNSSNRFLAPWHAYRIGKSILENIPKGEPLIISAQDPFESGIVAWLLCRQKAKLQLQIHTDLFSPYFRRERWENVVRLMLARFLLPRADCIRVVSRRILMSLKNELGIDPRKVTVLPIWSAPMKKQELSESRVGLRILIVSRLEPEKGIRDSLSAFAGFLSKGGRGVLTIIGDGGERLRLEELVDKFRIRHSAFFEGWKMDLGSYYEKSDIFLSASKYEGWGVAVFDAVSLGVPVVMTDVGLAGEVVRDGVNGIIVPVGNIAAMENAITSIYEDSTLLFKMRNAPRPKRESFEEYLGRYREALTSCFSKAP